MNQNRMLFPLFSIAAVLFLVALFRQLGCGTSEVLQKKLVTHFNGSPNDRPEPPSFEQIARKYGTDKVTGHSYQSMYEKYLSPLRNLPVKMLEIGLGCNMDYGPGASYYTWLEYFHNVELYFIESEAACAEKYKDKTASAHVFTGDQADAGFLEQFAADTTADSQFDIIIDDGGHTMEQQITSLEHLWPIVKPGGLYVIEDLQTSYWEDYGGDPFTTDRAKHTTMKYLYHVLDDIMVGRVSKPISYDLLSVDCMAEICTLQKRIADA